VVQSEASLLGADEVPDSLGGVISPRQNVMFETIHKGTYEHLPSRINSGFQSPCRPITPIDKNYIRALLYQQLRHGNSPFSKSWIPVKCCVERDPGLFLWFALDKVPDLNTIIPCSITDLFIASIIPCLALQGVAGSIASSRTLRAKVLLRGFPCIMRINSDLN
jgi:hypothetical protein